jgi:hypothetical protein
MLEELFLKIFRTKLLKSLVFRTLLNLFYDPVLSPRHET